MSAYFVTATGTDIGKTYVTAGLIRHLRNAGRQVSAVKPVASGFENSGAAQSDPGILLEALGEPLTEATLACVSPWRFTAPLSPDMAAAREGRTIDFEKLVEFCREAIDAHDGTLFIEGVGGIMVPLDGRHTVLDWARALDVPLIVVTGSYLGSVSHTLTALEVIARAELRVAALIVNESVGSTVPQDELMATLRGFATTIPIRALPRAASRRELQEAFREFASLLQSS